MVSLGLDQPDLVAATLSLGRRREHGRDDDALEGAAVLGEVTSQDAGMLGPVAGLGQPSELPDVDGGLRHGHQADVVVERRREAGLVGGRQRRAHGSTHTAGTRVHHHGDGELHQVSGRVLALHVHGQLEEVGHVVAALLHVQADPVPGRVHALLWVRKRESEAR